MKRSSHFIAAIVIAAFGFLPVKPAMSQSLVADLSEHHVAITTGFTGAELLLFGAIEGDGDIVVTITGPDETVTVRKKDRVGGIWINTDEIAFERVPSFYAIAATRPLEDVAPEDVRESQQIGAEYIGFTPAKVYRGLRPEQISEFRQALLRLKQSQNLFSAKVGKITVVSERLFRTRVWFPANMRPGLYTASVYLIHDGNQVSAQTTPLRVEKVGVGAEVYDFAHGQSALYGIAAILIAAASGWLAAVAFRKM